jgi:hypothetical protein
MGATGLIHHFGSFCLFMATILLIITCISAPVVSHIAMLKVRYDNNAGNVHYGTFGWCADIAGSRHGCSGINVGYDAVGVLEDSGMRNFRLSDASSSTANALTNVMILHPVACGLNFIAFLLAVGASVVGSFLASMMALLAFLVTLVVLITDFVGFALIRNAVNRSNTGAEASYGAASWTLLAAAILSLIGSVILFFTCCSARIHRRRQSRTKTEHYEGSASSRRRWF